MSPVFVAQHIVAQLLGNDPNAALPDHDITQFTAGDRTTNGVGADVEIIGGFLDRVEPILGGLRDFKLG